MFQTEIKSAFTKKFLGLTFVLSAAAMAFAQEKMSVSGNIVDNAGSPVPYASVTFTHKGNSVFNDATLADEKGHYSLQLAPGNYDVSIEAIDFKRLTTTKQVTRPGSLGNIAIEAESSATLTPTQDIEGVTITAQATRPYRVELDKKVYDPSQDVISKGGNLQDVLTNVPSVAVDTDGTVSMRGNSNVRFLINGKPSALLGIDSGANAMQSIPADQIERIEVITNPSSKFEASGTAGILNIILKKAKGMGFNGSVTGSVGYLPSTNLNTNLSWRRGDWSWFVNGGGGYNRREGKNENDTRFFDSAGNTTSFFEQNSLSESESNHYNINAGFVVDLTEKTSFNLSGMARHSNNEGESTLDIFNYGPSRNITSQQIGLGNSFSKNNSLQGDIGLDHKFNDEGHNMFLSFSLQQNKNISNDISERFTGGNLLFGTLTDNNTVNNSMIGKFDYELPIGEQSKLETGYRFDKNKNDYDFLNQEAAGNSPYLVADYFSGNVLYDEMINAGYAQFKSKTGKFGYQAGLRLENTAIDIDYTGLTGESSTKAKNYTGLFPSVFLSYDLGESTNSQLLLNFSRRISRPRSWFMVPYPTSLASRENLFRGNPDLNPEYISSFELGYSFQKRKLTINPTLYYRYTQDETRMVVVPDPTFTNGLNTTPFNIGNEHRYGLDINTNADILPWWRIMGSVDLYGYKSEGVFSDMNYVSEPMSFEGDGFSTRIRLTNTFKVDKNTNLQLQSFFHGGEKTQSYERKNMFVLSLGANRTIWDGNGTIAFNVQDILGTRGRRMISYGEGFERESFMQWMPRTFNLSLTYRFKQGEKVEQPKRRRDNNSNSQNGDDDMLPM